MENILDRVAYICMGFCALIGVAGLVVLTLFLCHAFQDRWGERRKLLDRYDAVMADNIYLRQHLAERK